MQHETLPCAAGLRSDGGRRHEGVGAVVLDTPLIKPKLAKIRPTGSPLHGLRRNSKNAQGDWRYSALDVRLSANCVSTSNSLSSESGLVRWKSKPADNARERSDSDA
jgi:hypothetical protein